MAMLSSSSRLEKAVAGKRVVVTGASDGIGEHLSLRLAKAGAHVILVARTEEKLKAVGDKIREDGGKASEYVADLSKDEACQEAIAAVLKDFGSIDIFVSNAGRSIRRSAKYEGGDRFHDFQRLMALNFFGGLRMILGFLPAMIDQRAGHIVHISSFGVPTRQPRFAGYSASKAAMDAAIQSTAGEVQHYGINTSTVYMPLVETKMVKSRGHSYDHISMLPMDMACDLIEYALITKARDVMDAPSRFLALVYFFKPDFIVNLNSLIYTLESEHPPEGMGRDESRKRLEQRQQKNKKKGGFSGLKALGKVLWFFSRLEMFCLGIGVPLMARDPIIFLFLALFFTLYPIVVLLMYIVKGARMAYKALAGPQEIKLAEDVEPSSSTPLTEAITQEKEEQAGPDVDLAQEQPGSTPKEETISTKTSTASIVEESRSNSPSSNTYKSEQE
mmetsp:Transcript_82871/g.173519  ORF Transcript_82871/g.173519 Transcript_82871/m.173519 type:complete len:445 (+) Transcript_82871:286-1620(+)|eukprot:CAMPEP_0206444344 /NCGR_PEP_ID=MMETSP0324_2-20121206/14860_1 /ASSEMBLY_ACC=CAM_ASM_000836 /TAXON_ID=2866 /ORGANISM="Crypthecodinium cohnii, Strain Seligo" /LENGTH=444 /DNA_ID=CAMNT_0053912357 /DNA_START=281 /DNA_END=1615 /DNA_ORIENTATION=-